MSSFKDKIADAGQSVADAAKQAGQKVAEGASQAVDSVKETTGMGTSCGEARGVSEIQPHMDVIASCGCPVGKVDHLEGSAIKLTRNDSPDGQHHYVPTGWVSKVDEHVHLNKNADETKREWKNDVAACGSCGA